MTPGHPWPLGAHWDGHGVNFAVFSAHARAVELCLFDAGGTLELQRLPLPAPKSARTAHQMFAQPACLPTSRAGSDRLALPDRIAPTH